MLFPLSSQPTYARLCSVLLAIFLTTFSASVFGAGARFDFDGDGRADLSVFRPSNGWWYFHNSFNGFQAYRFGQNGDQPVAEDYDGDGITDAAVFRQGVWYRLTSSTSTYDAVSWGVAGDMPVPADLDGDGRADMVVFRPSTSQWFAISSQTGESSVRTFGAVGDIPLPADFDGDRIADITVFRPSNGTWYRINSANGGSYVVRQFGQTGDIPLTGDFDGDGRSDLAVWRPSNSNWYFQTDNSFWAVNFGVPTDTPVPADYDGDGKTDIAVYRPGNGHWYRINSATSTFQAQSFGLEADIPAASQIAPQVTPVPTQTPTPAITPTPTPTATATPVLTPTPTPSSTPYPSTCDYFASPSGTPQGNGSISSAWDLNTALSKSTVIVAGKTLCLQGGTYRGKFTSSLTGGTVRSYPGEWAVLDGYKTTTLVSGINGTVQTFTVADASGLKSADAILIDDEMMQIGATPVGNSIFVNRHWGGTAAASHSAGATVYHYGNQLLVTGSNTVYRDFEITSSHASRNNSSRLTDASQAGVSGQGTGNSYINLIVHDNHYEGLFIGSSTSNTLIYGCLIINNGCHNGAGKPFGHGLYLENASGYSRIYDNIILNNFNFGIQAYGVSGPYVGGDIRGDVVAGAGAPLGLYNRNMIYGPNSQQSPTGTVTESVFHHSPGRGGSVDFGYGAGVGVGSVTNNYFFGSLDSFKAGNVNQLTFSGNKFHSLISNSTYVAAAVKPYTWDNNTYYNQPPASVWRQAISGEQGYAYAIWKSRTGFDTNSTITTADIPDTVIVRPNAYEAGRANIVIYAPTGPSSINVNLSTTGLVDGQRYIIKNAFNYSGPAVLTGTYNAASPLISVPLTGSARTVATPTGMPNTPTSTSPTFFVMIIKGA